MPMIFTDDNRVQAPYGVFGYRRSGGSVHAGIDVDTTGEATVHSTVAGRVKYARSVAKGAAGWGRTWEWGSFVWVVAPDGSDHIFAHCKAGSLRVSEGAPVREGQALATMGSTGNAAFDPQGEHVHYEVRQGGKAVDPTPWCGIPNRVGSTKAPAGPTHKEDDDMNVRIYKVLAAYESRKDALREFASLTGAAEDPREYLLTSLGNAGYSDGKTRIMSCRMKRGAATASIYAQVRADMQHELLENEILV